jgi:hypothetical protein
MNNILYCATIAPAKESPDGDSPHQIILTQETNGFAVWESSFDIATDAPVQWHRNRDAAIEAAVLLADERRVTRAQRRAA